MKQFLFGGFKKGDQKRKPEPEANNTEDKDDGFLEPIGCLMIFGETAAYDSKRRQKFAHCEVYAVELATPTFIRWSGSMITLDRSDHPESIPQPGRYPLVIDPIIGTKWLTKVLMDGGSDLNIMYAETLDALGISWTRIQPTGAPFHGIIPGKQAKPLGQIDLSITFGNLTNYRMETLNFEVVRFHGTYHAILGRPCYAKFTIGTSFQCTYECEVECCELTSVIIAFEELAVIKEATIEEAPDSKWSTRYFEPTEDTKEILIDPSSSEEKVVCIGTSLSPK
jgi:hypothetical protein